MFANTAAAPLRLARLRSVQIVALCINTWLVKVTGSNAAPLYYGLFSLAIGVLSTLVLPEPGRDRFRTPRAASQAQR